MAQTQKAIHVTHVEWANGTIGKARHKGLGLAAAFAQGLASASGCAVDVFDPSATLVRRYETVGEIRENGTFAVRDALAQEVK